MFSKPYCLVSCIITVLLGSTIVFFASPDFCLCLLVCCLTEWESRSTQEYLAQRFMLTFLRLSRPGLAPCGNVRGAFDLSLPTIADHRWIQMSPPRSAQTKPIIQLPLIIVSYFSMSAISQRHCIFIYLFIYFLRIIHLSGTKSCQDSQPARCTQRRAQ